MDAIEELIEGLMSIVAAITAKKTMKGRWVCYESIKRHGYDSLTWGDPADTPPMPELRFTIRELLTIRQWKM